MIFRLHWLKLFSNWSKYNAKPSPKTKWREISMECFHFFEQTFPRILTKSPLSLSSTFILSIPGYRHINFQWFPDFPCFSWGEFWGVTSRNGRGIPLCVRLLQRMTYWSIDLLMIFFFVSPLYNGPKFSYFLWKTFEVEFTWSSVFLQLVPFCLKIVLGLMMPTS